MAWFTIFIKAYARICNIIFWPLSHKLKKRAPSLEIDFRKAAFPITFEEYISTTLFTSIFVAIEVFFLFSIFLLLFASTSIEEMTGPGIVENISIAPPPDILPETVADEIALEIISESTPFFLRGQNITFALKTDSPHTSCSLELDGSEYVLIRAIFPQEGDCGLEIITGQNLYSVCYTPEPAGGFTYNYTFVPQVEKQYVYEVDCTDPKYHSSGVLHVYDTLYKIGGQVNIPEAQVSLMKNGDVVHTITAEPFYEFSVSPGIYSIRASHFGAEATKEIDADSTQVIDLDLIYGKVTITAPVKGAISFTKGEYGFAEPFDEIITKELGVGEWQYTITSQGYASITDSFRVGKQTETAIEARLVVQTELEITVEPEELYSDEDIFVYVNYTNKRTGKEISAYTAEVRFDGNNASIYAPGVFFYRYDSNSTGEHTLTVMANKRFYEDQYKVISFTVGYNLPQRQAFETGLKIASVLLAGIITLFIFMVYPSQRASSREQKIDASLPFVLSHMASMARSGVSVSQIVKLLAKYSAYEELQKEFSKINKSMEILGNDLITSIKTAAENTPSKKFSQMLDSLATTVHSGGNTSMFFKEKEKETRLELISRSKEKTSTIALLGEIYVIIFVAAPIFMTIMLVAMEFVAAESLPMPPIDLLKVVTYFMIPLMTAGFLIYLGKEVNAGV